MTVNPQKLSEMDLISELVTGPGSPSDADLLFTPNHF